MTMRARGAKAARRNAGSTPEAWSKKATISEFRRSCWRRCLPAAMECGGGCPGVASLFVFSFFRDPERVIPPNLGGGVSGDGRVVVVTDEEYERRPGKRVSIFWRCGTCT